MKIDLRQNAETLLIPLYGRAQMSKRGIFPDADAERAVEQIEYDFAPLRIQQKTQILMGIRSMLIDACAQSFFSAHPNSCALSLGCGLDARERRLNTPRACGGISTFRRSSTSSAGCTRRTNATRRSVPP